MGMTLARAEIPVNNKDKLNIGIKSISITDRAEVRRPGWGRHSSVLAPLSARAEVRGDTENLDPEIFGEDYTLKYPAWLVDISEKNARRWMEITLWELMSGKGAIDSDSWPPSEERREKILPLEKENKFLERYYSRLPDLINRGVWRVVAQKTDFDTFAARFGLRHGQVLDYFRLYRSLSDQGIIRPDEIKAVLDLGANSWYYAWLFREMFPRLERAVGVEKDDWPVKEFEEFWSKLFNLSRDRFRALEGNIFRLEDIQELKMAKHSEGKFDLVLLQRFLPGYDHESKDYSEEWDYYKFFINVSKLLRPGGKLVLTAKDLDQSTKNRLKWVPELLAKVRHRHFTENHMDMGGFSQIRYYPMHVYVIEQSELQKFEGLAYVEAGKARHKARSSRATQFYERLRELDPNDPRLLFLTAEAWYHSAKESYDDWVRDPSYATYAIHAPWQYKRAARLFFEYLKKFPRGDPAGQANLYLDALYRWIVKDKKHLFRYPNDTPLRYAQKFSRRIRSRRLRDALIRHFIARAEIRKDLSSLRVLVTGFAGATDGNDDVIAPRAEVRSARRRSTPQYSPPTAARAEVRTDFEARLETLADPVAMENWEEDRWRAEYDWFFSHFVEGGGKEISPVEREALRHAENFHRRLAAATMNKPIGEIPTVAGIYQTSTQHPMPLGYITTLLSDVAPISYRILKALKEEERLGEKPPEASVPRSSDPLDVRREQFKRYFHFEERKDDFYYYPGFEDFGIPDGREADETAPVFLTDFLLAREAGLEPYHHPTVLAELFTSLSRPIEWVRVRTHPEEGNPPYLVVKMKDPKLKGKLFRFFVLQKPIPRLPEEDEATPDFIRTHIVSSPGELSEFTFEADVPHEEKVYVLEKLFNLMRQGKILYPDTYSLFSEEGIRRFARFVGRSKEEEQAVFLGYRRIFSIRIRELEDFKDAFLQNPGEALDRSLNLWKVIYGKLRWHQGDLERYRKVYEDPLLSQLLQTGEFFSPLAALTLARGANGGWLISDANWEDYMGKLVGLFKSIDQTHFVDEMEKIIQDLPEEHWPYFDLVVLHGLFFALKTQAAVHQGAGLRTALVTAAEALWEKNLAFSPAALAVKKERLAELKEQRSQLWAAFMREWERPREMQTVETLSDFTTALSRVDYYLDPALSPDVQPTELPLIPLPKTQAQWKGYFDRVKNLLAAKKIIEAVSAMEEAAGNSGTYSSLIAVRRTYEAGDLPGTIELLGKLDEPWKSESRIIQFRKRLEKKLIFESFAKVREDAESDLPEKILEALEASKALRKKVGKEYIDELEALRRALARKAITLAETKIGEAAPEDTEALIAFLSLLAEAGEVFGLNETQKTDTAASIEHLSVEERVRYHELTGEIFAATESLQDGLMYLESALKGETDPVAKAGLHLFMARLILKYGGRKKVKKHLEQAADLAKGVPGGDPRSDFARRIKDAAALELDKLSRPEVRVGLEKVVQSLVEKGRTRLPAKHGKTIIVEYHLQEKPLRNENIPSRYYDLPLYNHGERFRIVAFDSRKAIGGIDVKLSNNGKRALADYGFSPTFIEMKRGKTRMFKDTDQAPALSNLDPLYVGTGRSLMLLAFGISKHLGAHIFIADKALPSTQGFFEKLGGRKESYKKSEDSHAKQWIRYVWNLTNLSSESLLPIVRLSEKEMVERYQKRRSVFDRYRSRAEVRSARRRSTPQYLRRTGASTEAREEISGSVVSVEGVDRRRRGQRWLGRLSQAQRNQSAWPQESPLSSSLSPSGVIHQPNPSINASRIQAAMRSLRENLAKNSVVMEIGTRSVNTLRKVLLNAWRRFVPNRDFIVFIDNIINSFNIVNHIFLPFSLLAHSVISSRAEVRPPLKRWRTPEAARQSFWRAEVRSDEKEVERVQILVEEMRKELLMPSEMDFPVRFIRRENFFGFRVGKEILVTLDLSGLERWLRQLAENRVKKIVVDPQTQILEIEDLLGNGSQVDMDSSPEVAVIFLLQSIFARAEVRSGEMASEGLQMMNSNWRAAGEKLNGRVAGGVGSGDRRQAGWPQRQGESRVLSNRTKSSPFLRHLLLRLRQPDKNSTNQVQNPSRQENRDPKSPSKKRADDQTPKNDGGGIGNQLRPEVRKKEDKYQTLKEKFGDRVDEKTNFRIAHEGGLFMELWLEKQKAGERRSLRSHVFESLDLQSGAILPGRIIRVGRDAEHEAEVILKLEKSGIVQGIPKLLRVGLTNRNQVWIEMDGIESGESLKNYPFKSLGEVFSVLLKAAQIFSEIHKSGIVHNDIKPANVIANAREEVQLIDFELAKPAGTVTFGGDRSYLPRLAFKRSKPDRLKNPDTDIYAFLLTVAEVLANYTWHTRDEEERSTIKELRLKYLSRILVGDLSVDNRENKPRSRWPKDLTGIIAELQKDRDEFISRGISNPSPRSEKGKPRAEVRSGAGRGNASIVLEVARAAGGVFDPDYSREALLGMLQMFRRAERTAREARVPVYLREAAAEMEFLRFFSRGA